LEIVGWGGGEEVGVRGKREGEGEGNRGGMEVPDEFNGAGDADALPLKVFAQRGEEPEPDFLVEDVEHRLIRAAH